MQVHTLHLTKTESIVKEGDGFTLFSSNIAQTPPVPLSAICNGNVRLIEIKPLVEMAFESMSTNGIASLSMVER